MRTTEKPKGAVAIVETNDAAAILTIIGKLATDPSVDVEKVERFMAMRRDELARQAQIAFNQAMKTAQAEMPRVVKNAENEQTRSRYATYDAITDAMQPVIDKHGFALTFGEAESPKPNHMRITCDVLHDQGHLKAYYADVPIDRTGFKGNPNKSDAHAFLSTVQYGRRALKLMIFDVAVKGAPAAADDGADSVHEGNGLISQAQAENIRKLLKEKRVGLNRLLTWLGVEALPDVRAVDYQRAIDALQRVRREKSRR
jgi:ERF superfamily